MKKINKIIIVIVTALALLLIASVLYVNINTVDGKDISDSISDAISEYKVEKLIVEKYTLNAVGRPILVSHNPFELGKESVDEITRLFENNNFKTTSKSYGGFVKPNDEYVEYIIHFVDANGNQFVVINCKSVEITNEDTGKLYIENGLEVTTYDVNTLKRQKYYMIKAKDKNWRYDLEKVLYG